MKREYGKLTPPHASRGSETGDEEAPNARLARLLSLPILPDFAEAGWCLQVAVPWLEARLWFVPDSTAASALMVRKALTRGQVWTAAELVDLLSIPGLTRDGARTVAMAKLAIAGELSEVSEVVDAAEPRRAAADELGPATAGVLSREGAREGSQQTDAFPGSGPPEAPGETPRGEAEGG